MRYFINISYKGTNYHGWQIQPNANTVQAEVNKALAIIYQEKIETVGSGRTDTRVHAKEQIFHCDLAGKFKEKEIVQKMNGLLPNDIVVNDMTPVNIDSHARFDAISRSYEYHILFKKSPFGNKESHFLSKKPDFTLMNEACKQLIGKNDFTSFSKVKTEVNNFYCDITRAEWQYSDDKAIFFVTANRFLRGMVRALVGTLLDVGYDKISLDEFSSIISSQNRARAGQSVPPQGLYLCNVRYPESILKRK